MRRVDKEIDNFREIWAIINACATARVAMVDEENKPYVVPMNFGFTAEATGPSFISIALVPDKSWIFYGKNRRSASR